MAGASRSAGSSPPRRRRRWSGFLSGLVVLRTTGLTLLMLTLVVATMLLRSGQQGVVITGGDDGLQGMEVWPIFGLFRFDLFGRTAYLYCLAVLFLVLAGRRGSIVHSPFGRSLTGIRENVRAHARDRRAGRPPPPHHLHDLGGARRRRRAR